MSMRVLHFRGLGETLKTCVPDYVVVSDDEEQDEAHLVQEWSRPGHSLESVSRIDDLPGLFPVNRILWT